MARPSLAEQRVLPVGRQERGIVAAIRIAAGLLWIRNVGWKVPPHFGQHADPDSPRDLYQWTSYAVEKPVFGPYAWLVENVILPNFTPFAWTVLLLELALGAFLLIGLATRLWAVLGAAQSLAILLSVANAPGEWIWAYVLMILLHAAIFATAAGRYAGLDGVLRPRWHQLSGSRGLRSRSARLLEVAS